jgi:hypothetical protein
MLWTRWLPIGEALHEQLILVEQQFSVEQFMASCEPFASHGGVIVDQVPSVIIDHNVDGPKASKHPIKMPHDASIVWHVPRRYEDARRRIDRADAAPRSRKHIAETIKTGIDFDGAAPWPRRHIAETAEINLWPNTMGPL